MMQEITGYKLFNYQSQTVPKGIDMLNTYNSLFLMDETGLGKTVTTATILYNIAPKKILIISPNPQKTAWGNIMKLTGLNYDICGNRNIPTYKSDYDFVVIDESHKIGKCGGKTYNDIFRLVKYNDSKLIILGATPYNNDLNSFIDILALFNLPDNSIPFIGLNAYFIRALYNQQKLDIIKKFDLHTFKQISEEVENRWDLGKNLEKIAEFLSYFCIRNERKNIIKDENNSDVFKSFPNLEKHLISPAYNNEAYGILGPIGTYKAAWQNQESYFSTEKYESFGPLYKTLLYKRLESSFTAFYDTIKKTADHITSFLESENDKKTHEQYPAFEADLLHDLKILTELLENKNCENDLIKMKAVFNEINNEKTVIFSEYHSTFNMLCAYAKEHSLSFISYTSTDGDDILDKITYEFDANSEKQTNKYNLLICTDVLAESVNLHRAKKLIHFDQKWNPSRIIQREGRVNRIRKDLLKTNIDIFSVQTHAYIENQIKLEEKIDNKLFYAEKILALKPHTIYPTIEHKDHVIKTTPHNGNYSGNLVLIKTHENINLLFDHQKLEFIKPEKNMFVLQLLDREGNIRYPTDDLSSIFGGYKYNKIVKRSIAMAYLNTLHYAFEEKKLRFNFMIRNTVFMYRYISIFEQWMKNKEMYNDFIEKIGNDSRKDVYYVFKEGEIKDAIVVSNFSS